MASAPKKKLQNYPTQQSSQPSPAKMLVKKSQILFQQDSVMVIKRRKDIDDGKCENAVENEMVQKPNIQQQVFKESDDSRSLHGLYKRKLGLDFEIILPDIDSSQTQRFKLHKIVFVAHLSKSDATGIKDNVDLSEYETALNVSLIEPVVEFLYTRAISVNETNVEDLLKIATALKLQTLKDCCITFLKTTATSDNVLQYLNLANNQGLDELKEPLTNSVITFLPRVLINAEVKFLDADTLCQLLEKEAAHSEGETIPATAVSNWLSYHSKPEKVESDTLDKLAQLIDLHKITVPDLESILETHCGLLALEQCKTILFKKVKPGLFDKMRTTPQVSPVRKTATLSTTEKEDEKLPMLHVLTTVPSFVRELMGTDMDSQKFEWPAGDQYQGVSAVLSQLLKTQDLQFNEWKPLLDQHFMEGANNGTRKWLTTTQGAIAVVKDRLYVIGGTEPNHPELPWKPSKTVFCYDFESKGWWPVSPMLHERRHFGMATGNGFLYVLGGQGMDARWQSLNPLPDPSRAFCSLVSTKDQLFIIGGATMNMNASAFLSLNSILRYDDSSDTWTNLIQLQNPRHFAGTVILDEGIYIIGGIHSDPQETSTDTYEYSVEYFLSLQVTIRLIKDLLPLPIIGNYSCTIH